MIDFYDDQAWQEGLQKIWDDYDKYIEEEERKEQEEKKRLEESFNRGVEAGIKQMMDKIQKNCLLGKPVMANDELYFFKTTQQNLIDIMDDLDGEYGIQKEKQYIVPIHKIIDGECMEFKVIIRAKTPYEAWCYAYVVFESEDKERPGGWLVRRNYDEYDQLK